MYKKIATLSLGVLFLTACNSVDNHQETGKDWPAYGGNLAGNRYSPLDQINTSNVAQLQVAWKYNANGLDGAKRPRPIQCQPIVVNGILYGTTPDLKLFALDGGTGNQLWLFDPQNDRVNPNRGVVYWENGDDKRILYTVGSNLYAVNANTGEAITSFGADGIVDLHEGIGDGLDADMSKLGIRATSPGIVYEDVFVIGSSVSESGSAAPGTIRAFNVVTGKLLWKFHTVPRPGETGYDTWPKDAYKTIGGVNNWAGMSLDPKTGVVFFGTGSPGSDFYGGNREGKNLFADCIVALNAKDGSLKWYYQTISHDLWDRDEPCPPNLTTITQNGKRVDVVVQATKDGLVYVLNRETGESIFPVEERAVPTDGLPGEKPWPTQKYPTKPAPISRQVFTEDDISTISPEAEAYTREMYENYKTPNKFAPPSEAGTLLFGYSGGAEWGGNAIDPQGILYQNANDNPWLLQMTVNKNALPQEDGPRTGKTIYLQNCSACHGADRKGNGTDFPDLTQVGQRYNKEKIFQTITNGSGRMPAFNHLSKTERQAVVDFLVAPEGIQSREALEGHAEMAQPEQETEKVFGFEPQYIAKAWTKLTDPNGYPGVKPPWGTLNAIDLNTGEYLWKVPLGEFPELTKLGIPITGTESYGGPIVTAGGLVFIAGTTDERLRAFDKKTGKVVWEYQLPAGGFATPITYEVKGRQYVVIAAGGGRGQKPGGDYIAFALPQ